jgi:hypothetical protein
MAPMVTVPFGLMRSFNLNRSSVLRASLSYARSSLAPKWSQRQILRQRLMPAPACSARPVRRYSGSPEPRDHPKVLASRSPSRR